MAKLGTVESLFASLDPEAARRLAEERLARERSAFASGNPLLAEIAKTAGMFGTALGGTLGTDMRPAEVRQAAMGSEALDAAEGANMREKLISAAKNTNLPASMRLQMMRAAETMGETTDLVAFDTGRTRTVTTGLGETKEVPVTIKLERRGNKFYAPGTNREVDVTKFPNYKAVLGGEEPTGDGTPQPGANKVIDVKLGQGVTSKEVEKSPTTDLSREAQNRIMQQGPRRPDITGQGTPVNIPTIKGQSELRPYPNVPTEPGQLNFQLPSAQRTVGKAVQNPDGTISIQTGGGTTLPVTPQQLAARGLAVVNGNVVVVDPSKFGG